MSYRVRFTVDAQEDLDRLYGFLLVQAADDWVVADRALESIARGIALLEHSPFSCRKIADDNAFLRELIIGFGAAGYVVLFEIEDVRTLTVLAVRHQREDDYH